MVIVRVEFHFEITLLLTWTLRNPLGGWRGSFFKLIRVAESNLMSELIQWRKVFNRGRGSPPVPWVWIFQGCLFGFLSAVALSVMKYLRHFNIKLTSVVDIGLTERFYLWLFEKYAQYLCLLIFTRSFVILQFKGTCRLFSRISLKYYGVDTYFPINETTSDSW